MSEEESVEDYECFKCGVKITEDQEGCMAMEHYFHVKCFTCVVCSDELRGKQFYALKDSPYCEEDYLHTLHKCSVCEKPIVDRILRATEKTFHPDCFRCVECDRVLDDIPFTLSPDGKIHCVQDFHKKYAPRCCVCDEPIIPEPGMQETVRVVVKLDVEKSFHVDCYKCEDCDQKLSSEADGGHGCYPLDNHILCRGCNSKRAQSSRAAA